MVLGILISDREYSLANTLIEIQAQHINKHKSRMEQQLSKQKQIGMLYTEKSINILNVQVLKNESAITLQNQQTELHYIIYYVSLYYTFYIMYKHTHTHIHISDLYFFPDNINSPLKRLKRVFKSTIPL